MGSGVGGCTTDVRRMKARVCDKEAQKIYRSRGEKRGDSNAGNVCKMDTKSERDGVRETQNRKVEKSELADARRD